jgi:hypothetical protein
VSRVWLVSLASTVVIWWLHPIYRCVNNERILTICQREEAHIRKIATAIPIKPLSRTLS